MKGYEPDINLIFILITLYSKKLNIPFIYSNARIGLCVYNHGCQIKLCNDNYNISIQTHPLICGSSFAETEILDNNGKYI